MWITGVKGHVSCNGLCILYSGMKYSGHKKWDVRIAFILFDCSHIPLLSSLVILPRGYFMTRPVCSR